MPAKKKPRPARAAVIVTRLDADRRTVKQIPLPTAFITVRVLFSKRLDKDAQTSLPPMMVSQVTDTMDAAYASVMTPVLCR